MNSPENLTQSMYPSFFSVAVRKYPENKQVSGKVSFVSPLQVTVHSFIDIKVSGTLRRQSHHTQRKTEKDEYMCAYSSAMILYS